MSLPVTMNKTQLKAALGIATFKAMYKVLSRIGIECPPHKHFFLPSELKKIFDHWDITPEEIKTQTQTHEYNKTNAH
ncbi:hypothetical protein QQ054_01030 [Oscillatoria amoena NRMC-F 0135]|nr:hypothetical protein [Oscillatoria amoena NRMC-F 0135]